MPVLTLLDTLAIQSFVFATNRLRDAVGGSALVERLDRWVQDVCAPQRLLVAGGNALLRFDNENDARSAIARLSRAAHDDAPGLEFAVAHLAYESGKLAGALIQIRDVLQKAKFARRPSAPLLGLGVTASCVETHHPATALDNGRPIAATLAARRRPEIVAAWDRFLPSDADAFTREGGPSLRLRFPTELDNLGRTRDDRSLLGVVHLDGNGVGHRIGSWLRSQADQNATDDDVLNGLRELSSGLAQAANAALTAVVRRTVAAIVHDPHTGYEVRSRRLGRGFPLSTDDGTVYLPVRPILLGGDDLTFVCDGRLALDLTAAALSAFEKTLLPILGRVYASAGVAIARTHAPVLRVYELAEELCKSAKKRVRESRQEASALDWHIGYSSPTESLDETRRRQYGRGVTLRPYLLGEPGQFATWNWLSSTALGSGDDGFHGRVWSQRRSKVKDLMELARTAPAAVARGLEAWRLSAPELKLPAGLPPDGFVEGRTPLLDAAELLDLHLPLEEPTP